MKIRNVSRLTSFAQIKVNDFYLATTETRGLPHYPYIARVIEVHDKEIISVVDEKIDSHTISDLSNLVLYRLVSRETFDQLVGPLVYETMEQLSRFPPQQPSKQQQSAQPSSRTDAMDDYIPKPKPYGGRDNGLAQVTSGYQEFTAEQVLQEMRTLTRPNPKDLDKPMTI